MKKLVLLLVWLFFLLPLSLNAQTVEQKLTLGDQVTGTLEKGTKQRYLLDIQDTDLPVDVVMHSEGGTDSVLAAYDEQDNRPYRADRIGANGSEVFTIEPGGVIPAQIEVAFKSSSSEGEYILSVLPTDSQVSETPRPGEQVKRWAELDVTTAGKSESVVLPYQLYVPEDYDTTQSYPFMLFLHGAGVNGPRLDFLNDQVIPKLIEGGQDYPFIIASPHLTYNENWTDKADLLASLVAQLQTEFPIDPDRIYVTGLSMGGQGVWYFALAYPHLPAAIVSMAGFYLNGVAFVPTNICDLVNTPAWVFHGSKDELVPLKWEQALVDGLNECGGKVQFTVYPDANHGQTFETGFADPALYTWLLEQHQ